MPRIWSGTIEAHRRTVQDAILASAWELVRERGVLAVTMSELAAKAGIGRATLYKYFPDVESILLACHQRHVSSHLEHLRRLRDRAGDAEQALRAVLSAYALICHHRSASGSEDLVALLHRGEQVDRARAELLDLFRQLLAAAVAAGRVRDDVAAEELASYCVHALEAGGDLPSQAAVRRLAEVTLAGLRPLPPPT